jgi:hypothetical protein
MVKKGETPKGQRRFSPRTKREKEEVMETTKKTLKAIVMCCFIVFCMPGYAMANENAPAANLDNGAAYVTGAQDTALVNADVEHNTAEKGFGIKAIGATILACALAPWGTVSATITTATGLNMIYNTMVPERNDKPENTRVIVYNTPAPVRNDKPEINKVIELAAKDQNLPQ